MIFVAKCCDFLTKASFLNCFILQINAIAAAAAKAAAQAAVAASESEADEDEDAVKEPTVASEVDEETAARFYEYLCKEDSR